MPSFYEIQAFLEQFMEQGFGIGLFANLWSSSLSIATYVLSSLGLYVLAERRGIRNAWLSWIPVVNCWIIGCLSDQYRYVVKGEVKNKRKALLILNIVNLVLAIAVAVVVVIMAVSAVMAGMGANEEELIGVILKSVMSILALCLPVVGVSIAIKVLHYISTYDIYTSCTPQNNALFLVLSIIFPVTEPFFLFFSRKKDEGMPPRRQESQYIPPQPQSVEY